MVNHRKTNKRVRKNRSKKNQNRKLQKGGAPFANREEFKNYLKANWNVFKRNIRESGISIRNATFASLCTVILVKLIADGILVNEFASIGTNLGTAGIAVGIFANATLNIAINALRIPVTILHTAGAVGVVSIATVFDYVRGAIHTCPEVATVTSGLVGIASTIGVYRNLNRMENQLVENARPEETFLDGLLDFFETLLVNRLYRSEEMVRSDEIMGEVVRDIEINDIDMNIQHLLDGLREQIRNIHQDEVVPVEDCNGIPVEALVAITDVAHASLPSSRVTSPQNSQEESQSSMYSIDLESSVYDIDNSDMDELVNNKRSNEEYEPDNEDEHKSRRRRIDSQTDLGGSRKRRRRVSKKQKK